MVFILLKKIVAKSLPVKEGGGGGGQRGEQNVLKSMQELDDLLILLW